MEQNVKSEGKCLFCGEMFSKSRINKHLDSHLKQIEVENTNERSYLVKIEANPRWNSAAYFLLLWVNKTASMGDIDFFLRSIWLECCGHISQFSDPEVKKRKKRLDFSEISKLLEQGKLPQYNKLKKELDSEVPMSQKVKNIFRKGLVLEYEYDFGSSTYLILKVVEEYQVKADKKIVLLSRNEPLELLCDLCQKKIATQICTIHRDRNEDYLFCDKCAKKHEKKCDDFADYAAMPVVNSPRMGVCAYEGGRIDTERDGVFVREYYTEE
jgi:hypothetical protein